MGKHKNAAQDNIFLQFMTSHPDYALGFVKGDKIVQNEKWESLAKELNDAGPPTKEVSCWKKAWLDWKKNIKQKLAHNKTEVRETGGGAYNQFVLTRLEEQIAVISGLYKSVDGIENTQSFGVSENNEENDEEPSSSALVSPSPLPYRKRKLDLDELMENQNLHLEDISTKLQVISENQVANKTILIGIKNKLENLGNKYDTLIELNREDIEESKRHNSENEKHDSKIEEKYDTMIELKRIKIEECKRQTKENKKHHVQKEKHLAYMATLELKKIDAKLKMVTLETAKFDAMMSDQ